MKFIKISLFLFCLSLSLTSCNKDDGGNDIAPVELRNRAEVQAEDMVLLREYLGTHYYNSTDFNASPNPSIKDLIITKLGEGESVPTNQTLLEDAVGEPESLVFADTNYEYFILNLKTGMGESPKFSDLVRVRYEGFTLDDEIFDSAVTPVDFDLVSLVPGWRKAVPLFKASDGFMDNGDGTVAYLNHGVGVMFLPSGLGYFSNATPGISSYSPIIFKFDLLQTAQNDHDGDGIPSYLEDLNGDGEFTANFVDTTDETDDDTDGDTTPDYFDSDDDADGILTRNELERKTYVVDTNQGEQEPVLDSNIEFEISRSAVAGIITIKSLIMVDSNNNNIMDYLEKDIVISYRE